MKKEYLVTYIITVFENSVNYHYQNLYITGTNKLNIIDQMQDHFNNKIKPAFKDSVTCCILNIIEL